MGTNKALAQGAAPEKKDMGTNKALAQGGAPHEKKESENLKGQKSQKYLHQQLRKTKFCMFHLQGACQFGKDCRFAHSVTEMNSTPDLCKTQLCKAFADGKCEDPFCNYAHGHEELRSTAMFLKKTLCIWNEKGKCRNASNCRFAHGLEELRLHINKEAGRQQSKAGQTQEPKEELSFAESATQSKAGRQRKGKQNQKPKNSITSSNGSGSENTHISSPNSPRSGSSSKVFSRQCTSSTDFSWRCSSSDASSRQCSSASEPMKIQPQSVSPQQKSMGVPDQMQSQWQDSLSSRLAALESDYSALARSNGCKADLQADLNNLRKGLGLLTSQCSQIQDRMVQERMESSPVEMPPWMPCMLQSANLVTPYPDPASMLLWQMQMQD